MLRWTRLSCRAFRDDAVRLQLSALAYDLADFPRSLVLPTEAAYWSLTTLREKPVKTGGRIVRHGRYLVFQLAEVAVPCALFAVILAGSTACGDRPLPRPDGSEAMRPAEPRENRAPDRPAEPERTESACRPGSGGSSHPVAAVRPAFWLIARRPRRSLSGAGRAQLGNVESGKSA